MSKLLILANNDIGLYNFRKELLERLIGEGFELHIALPYGEFVENMKEMGCIFHSTEFDRRGTNPFQELKMVGMYKRILREVKPDVVLSYTIKPNIYGGMACAALKIPYIVNVTGLGTALGERGILQLVTIKLYRRAMRRVCKILFQNDDNEQFFTEHKIAVGRHGRIPGSGVNLERYRYLPYPTEGPAEFLFISRILREKGIDEYMEMAERIKEAYPDTVFRILGFCEDDSDKPDSYRKRIARLEEKGILHFEGMQKDITPFLMRAQCTIHPSFYPEGMSNVCLESAASGRPVITTLHTGCRETVEDGVTGFLVEPGNAQALTEAVRRFLAMPMEERAKMGREARRKMEREFDRQIVVDTYRKEINAAMQTEEK